MTTGRKEWKKSEVLGEGKGIEDECGGAGGHLLYFPSLKHLRNFCKSTWVLSVVGNTPKQSFYVFQAPGGRWGGLRLKRRMR